MLIQVASYVLEAPESFQIISTNACIIQEHNYFAVVCFVIPEENWMYLIMMGVIYESRKLNKSVI